MPCLNIFILWPYKNRSWLTKAHGKMKHVFYWVSIGITLHRWSNILAWIESSKKRPIRKQRPLEFTTEWKGNRTLHLHMFVAHILHVICGTSFQAMPVTCGRRLKLSIEDLVIRKFHEKHPSQDASTQEKTMVIHLKSSPKTCGTSGTESWLEQGELSWCCLTLLKTTLWRKNNSLQSLFADAIL